MKIAISMYEQNKFFLFKLKFSKYLWVFITRLYPYFIISLFHSFSSLYFFRFDSWLYSIFLFFVKLRWTRKWNKKKKMKREDFLLPFFLRLSIPPKICYLALKKFFFFKKTKSFLLNSIFHFSFSIISLSFSLSLFSFKLPLCIISLC